MTADGTRRVAVIGGGAAGMMAAIAAAENGASVVLIERNDRLGKKLRITGKGRCNVTNDCDTREFLEHVPTNPRFLYSALDCFSTEDTKSFFESCGVPLIASCHGSSVRDILSHTGILNLHRHHIFDYYVGIKRGSNLDFTYTINTWSDVNDFL